MRSMLQSIRYWALICLAGAPLLLGVFAVVGSRSLNDLPLLKFGFFLFGGFPVILVHELGHALAAWALGWRVLVIHVAPFALRLTPPLLAVRGDMGGPDVGGFVMPVPRSAAVFTKLRRIAISAGGPLASWILAGVCFAAVYGLDWHSAIGGSEDPLRVVLFATALYSLSAAIGSSIPNPTRGGNDAAHILSHAHKHKNDIGKSGLSYAHWFWESGVPISRWEPWIVPSLRETMPEAADYYEALDAIWRSDTDSAYNLVSRLEPAAPPYVSKVILSYLLCVDRGDVVGAEGLLASVKSFDGAPQDLMWLRELTFVEMSRLERDPDAANTRLKRLRRRIDGHPSTLDGFWSFAIKEARARLEADARAVAYRAATPG